MTGTRQTPVSCIAPQRFFDALRAASADGQHGLADGLRVLAGKGRAETVDVTGTWWLDVDTDEALEMAIRALNTKDMASTA